ncbi:XrtY-associated glycosyltransferase XYAG1 [Mucilaginibacter sp. UR6-11]|uniref:XrtY-associated glycosyltransferase XYAG1 n=1 Tax=Mucilaginibacter sp. UR6-11 TaxID=1435644 RepID=UPI001E35F050|nr:glycosyltransferase [Mucilaginibacter sp. UR6-11]MCC8425742.1 glycosyltransferase [Mucilaginibacter sp. UR6-11]
MKILQINASYKPAYIYGGPTMSVAKLSEQLTKANCTVTVFTTTANGNTELTVSPGIETPVDGVSVTYFKRITKDHSHLSPGLLISLWKNARTFDVIHIHAWWNLVSVLSAWIGLIRKVPVVISPRGTLSAYSFTNKNNLIKKIIHNLLGKRLLNGSFLHATSLAEQQALAEIIKPRAIFDIPNFVKIISSSRKRKSGGPILKLLFLSRIEEKKGLDILLHALPLLNIPYHLTIAGDGDENYINVLKNIAHYNLSDDNISWIGFQNDSKFDVFTDHDLLVLPSYNENFGNVVIESLSAGTAVLISGQVGLADYVVNNQLGWLCQTTPQSVSNAINDIAIQPDKLADISLKAPAIIHRDFDDDQLVKKYINMYQQIINHVRL